MGVAADTGSEVPSVTSWLLRHIPYLPNILWVGFHIHSTGSDWANTRQKYGYPIQRFHHDRTLAGIVSWSGFSPCATTLTSVVEEVFSGMIGLAN
jgi:hypothetical protein